MAVRSRKRPAETGLEASTFSKMPRRSASTIPPKPTRPTIRHQNYPDSGVGQKFHSVPYPLGLLPYDSWYDLHNIRDETTVHRFRCPQCRKEQKPTTDARKLYLVAERLSWEDGIVPTSERNQNEELNWGVNYKLGLLDPFVEDPEHVPGGKHSRKNKFHPYENQFEMKSAMHLVASAETLTVHSWAVWLHLIEALRKGLAVIEHDEKVSNTRSKSSRPLQEIRGNSARSYVPTSTSVTKSHDRATFTENACSLPTPASSFTKKDEDLGILSEPSKASSSPSNCRKAGKFTEGLTSSEVMSQQDSTIQSPLSYGTLQDFYSLLDQIERTSFVGAQFLEAYAERLQGDLCEDCWFKDNIDSMS